jgi:peptidoglycan hydrolase-like protein with peptidoglycan-binding domain
MPVNSLSRSSTSSVRTNSTRSTAATRTTRTNRAQVGHSNRDTFDAARSRTADRRSLAGYAGRGRSVTSAQRREQIGSSTGTLRRGMRNESVRSLQERLTASGFDAGPADGRFGPRTERALRDFQRSQGLRADGIAGRRTFGALNGAGGTTATTPGTNAGTGVDGTARLNQVHRGPGMTTGTITVNGNTYNFNSGSSRLYSTPTGTFRVTAHRNSRSDAGFTRDGVGFSFRMEDPRRPGSDRFYDPRAGRDRTALRIHPDGGARGTAGCIGIVGDAATLRRFRDDMNAELRRNGGTYTLRVN